MTTVKTPQDNGTAPPTVGSRLDRRVGLPRVQTLMHEAHKFQGRYKNFDLELMRKDARALWYIRVLDPRGCYAYDGWWTDSVGKSLEDAVAEALQGACLWAPNAAEYTCSDK